ncbi:DNA (cytosine-5-)-methyltransferase [Streptomyces sp. TP-A0874]|uniref:DNA (cytosine-5-)-methyltransferase n=1 Tax=Streptomyces sp. TP-A0874 TaxID=549819 RepID=UPI0008539424|nr:DNA (cytosine-5-)-methyltransferase [Streptomyces sp. TP-A0874]
MEQESQYYGVPLERSDYLPLERHEHSCSPEDFAQWLEGYGKDRRLAVDLFSGAGGLSLGLQRAGWTTAAAVDMDERALETHAANFPGMSLHMDLGKPEERDRLEQILEPAKGRIDLVAGGPPCQPFSRAGRYKIRHLVKYHGRDPEDLRKELWRAYLDVIRRIRPRAVLMENVPDMGLGDDFFVIRMIEQQLEDVGYATQVRLVDAWKYRVPQHRKRLILLARNDVEQFDWQPEISEKERTTLQDAIGDLPKIHVEPKERVGERVTPYTTPAEKQSWFAASMRSEVEPEEEGIIHDHMTRRVRQDDFEAFQNMTSKTSYPELSEEHRRYSTKHFTDKYKKLDWDNLSRSITAHIAKDGYWYIHPDQNRTLTVREAARVQTFPDHFRFAGTRSDAFRQIGNAVPPVLGAAAAEVLSPVSDGESARTPLRPKWRTAREELTAWAEARRQGPDWYQLPTLSSVQAAVGAVLSGAKVNPDQLRAMMEGLDGAEKLTRSALKELIAAAPTSSARGRLDRLTDIAGKRSIWAEDSRRDVPEQIGMKPAEKSLYLLLINEDLLWVGQGALRVAARLHGNKSDRTNRLSDGRVNLVKLVGAETNAPLRMAALRLIGNTVCTATKPLCDQCPLNRYCAGRENVAEDLFANGLIGTEARPSLPAQSAGHEPQRTAQGS